MDTKKLLMGTVVGGIAYFILGFLIYGMALMDTMAAYTNASCMRADADMVWWAMILGNFGFGALLTYIFLASGKVTSFGAGLQMGAAVSLLASISVDLMMFATTTLNNGLTGIVIDVVASTVIGALAGGAIGKVLGSGNKPAAA